jgi:hypothetical protein
MMFAYLRGLMMFAAPRNAAARPSVDWSVI